jgi:hypothetical protein
VSLIEALRVAERARLALQLEGLSRTAPEVAHRLNNDLALAVGTAELLQLHAEPALPRQLRQMVADASNGLTAAVTHIAQLQQVAQGAGGAARPVTPLPEPEPDR